MINHRISNLICRIRTAILSKKDGLIIYHSHIFNSKEILDLLSSLASNGFIYYSPLSKAWYLNNSPLPHLSNIQVRSKSGKRIYKGYKELKENEIVRSSSGVWTANQAKKKRIGGELLLKFDRII